MSENEVVRLECPDGRLATYATVAVRLRTEPLMWGERAFYPFGTFRLGLEVLANYRERAGDDGNDPVTCFPVTDPDTPRNKP